MVIYTINILIFLSRVIIANFFSLMSLIFWIIDKTFAVVFLFYLSFFSINYIFALTKVKKNNFRTISILVSANIKVFSKNKTFSSLF